MILQVILSCLIPVSMKIVKLIVTLENEREVKLEKKAIMLSILHLETKLLRLLKKNEAIRISEHETLTKVKVKKSQEKYLNFANSAIQGFCDDIELDMNDVNTLLYACAKTVESELGVKLKKKT